MTCKKDDRDLIMAKKLAEELMQERGEESLSFKIIQGYTQTGRKENTESVLGKLSTKEIEDYLNFFDTAKVKDIFAGFIHQNINSIYIEAIVEHFLCILKIELLRRDGIIIKTLNLEKGSCEVEINKKNISSEAYDSIKRLLRLSHVLQDKVIEYREVTNKAFSDLWNKK